MTLLYPCKTTFIDHWLVAGPLALPVSELERFSGDNYKLQIIQHYQALTLPLPTEPMEETKFQFATALSGEQALPWRVVHTGDDHFVDLTTFYHTCHYLCAWAYSGIECPTAQNVEMILTSNAPAEVWLNGKRFFRHEEFSHQIPQRTPFRAALQAGLNHILVRCEAVAVRECPFALALQIPAMTAAPWQIQLPSAIAPIERRQKLEELLRLAYLEQDLYHNQDEIIVKWPVEMTLGAAITVRLQTPQGRIYTENRGDVRAGAQVKLGKANLRPEGSYQIMLMPDVEEYYLHGMRVQHQIPLRIVNAAFSETPYGTIESRRQEALVDAARRESNIYSEIAKMALGRWNQLKPAVITKQIDTINSRADCSDFYLLGLLGALLRYGDAPAFPAELKAQIESCAVNFKYWMDEPGNDAMCYWSENHQILFHACEILAGQCYPDQNFSNVDQTGAWHRQKGEERALAWLRKRAAGGFREWDSNVYFEHDVLALTHLADLAESLEVAEMAAILLDKLFYSMALNSFRGVFGSTHGRSYAPYLKGGRLELTSGLARLLWGQGCFNEHILGSVSLACASYELPDMIAQIATSPWLEVWSREQHAGVMEEGCDRASGAWQVNKVTYKTPDFMLCSVQDFNPGGPGYQQHIWQATFGADAVVFTTHPPCISEEGSHRPNFWHGNATLPRVAQWKDLLMAIYHLPADDWMGFTHAYFPIAAFDETSLRNNWAFARKGEGYLAITAAQGLTLTTSGDNAYRELRSPGDNNIWLCQLGRAATDGSFAEFQAKVLALDLRWDELAVTTQTLRGEEVKFGWQGTLQVNGVAEPISGFKHYDSPFCTCELGAPEMIIQCADQALRLNF